MNLRISKAYASANQLAKLTLQLIKKLTLRLINCSFLQIYNHIGLPAVPVGIVICDRHLISTATGPANFHKVKIKIYGSFPDNVEDVGAG